MAEKYSGVPFTWKVMTEKYSGTPFRMKVMTEKYNGGSFAMKVMGAVLRPVCTMKAMKHRLEFPILSKMKTMATKFVTTPGGIDKRHSDYNLMPAKEGDFIVK